MKFCSVVRLSGVISALVLSSSLYGVAQAAAVKYFPANKAMGVNPDTHLVLTFPGR
jgi:hypothetical protein